MPKVAVKNCGVVGVIRDLSTHELPIEAWTDASNIRFLDGYAFQFLGHGQVYDTPTYAPQFFFPVYIAGARYWVYATATKQFAVSNTTGSTVHTDITHVTARAGVVNQWTGFVFGGIPILNVGDTAKIPMYWDTNLANKFVDLTNWPAATYAAVLVSFKNMIIGLNITDVRGNLPFMVKWSHPAVPGSLPSTYDITDATKDAGEFDLADGQDPIIFGLGLKDSLMVYKERSTWAIDYIGGVFILRPRKIFGMSGILNKHCAVDADNFHFVVTGSDIVIHDGFSASSVLDKKARRDFFQGIDVAGRGLVHCSLNPFLNEIFVNFPSIGATSCDSALVYNYVDKTVTYRTMPNVNYATFGPVDTALGGTFDQDSDPFDSDLTAFNGPDYTPDTVRMLMASADTKLFMLDASASFDGVLPDAYLERRGLSLDMPERIKLVTGIRPRIAGNPGATVIVEVGYADDPDDEPTYTAMTYTIGNTLKCDFMVSARYLAIRFSSGTAYQWRLGSYDIFYEDGGEF